MPIVERLLNGGYLIADIIDGYRVHRRYFDYTRKEAIAEFRAEMRELRKENQNAH